MKSDPSEFDLVAPANLQTAITMLAENPSWLAIAGGTDVMVQFAAGTLAARKLISIWNLPELRRIEVLPAEIQIGAGCTYTDLRRDPMISREFPLLAQAASWTGGIANQNRGTLGGNIVNASPAADSLPALLVYEAELILTAARGERRIAYRNFHKDYKKMDRAPAELIRAICVPRRYSGYVQYARKVGARNAQAISKACIAALGRVEKCAMTDVRIALGSVAPTPIRLIETERILVGRQLADPETESLARKTAIGETRPIDDIRSTARYRAAVVGNIVAEFLQTLAAESALVETLARWNDASPPEAESEILACCGSGEWARQMARRRPFANYAALFRAAEEVWRGLSETDWMEAFRSHPRIGEFRAAQQLQPRSAAWSSQEQSKVAAGDHATKAVLAERNREYERQFGYVFIVCATGKSGPEILEILERRLKNDSATELQEAAEQQRQITQIRLKKWLGG
jgi:OHCU decarboxylase